MGDADPGTARLADGADAIAPDGSEVRRLLRTSRLSAAHFALPAGEVSRAVVHREVEEVWYVLEGRGEMWRRGGDGAEVLTALDPGVAVTIPPGTRFQFRSFGPGRLAVFGVTVPPWPRRPAPSDPPEAEPVTGIWEPGPRR